MNLDTFKVNEDSWMELYTPDGTKTDIRINLVSRDSKTYKSRIRKLAEKNRRNSKGLSVADLESESMNIFVSCTIGWENVEVKGKAIECTPENVEMIFEEYPWIYDAVRDFIDDRTNFLSN